MNDFLPELPDLNQMLEEHHKRRQPNSKVTLNDQQTDSLLSQIAKSRPVGALAKIGHILDTPGGVVRTALVGRNPLPAIFDPDQRASGRDVLEHAGVLGPNQEGFDAGDVAGFAAEVALDPLTWFGGAASKAIGKGLEKSGVKAAVRYGNIPGTSYSPGRHFHQAFNADVKGTYTRAGQEAAAELSKRQREAETGVRGMVARQTQDLSKIGLGTHEQENSLRQLYEGVRQPANEIESRLLREKDALFAKQMGDMQSLGMKRNAFADVAPEIEGEAAGGIKYTPRRASMPQRGGTDLGPFQSRDPSAIGRKAPLKGIPGGTVDLKQVFGDKELNDLIDSGAKLGDVVTAAKKKYQHLIPEHYQRGVTEAGEPIIADRMTAIMKLSKRLPREVREAGLFGNSTIQDLATGATGGARAIEATRSMLDVVNKHAVTATDDMLRARQAIPVKKVLQKFGVSADAVPEDILEKALPSDLAREVLGFHDRWQAPGAVSKLGSAIDQYNSLFKAGVLSWPARHVRDLVSGLHRNWQAGHVGGLRVIPSAIEAFKVARGGAIKDVEKIPIIAKTLAERGLPATPEAGMDVFRELSYAHQVAGPGQSRLAQVGDSASARTAPVKKIEDIVHSLPGANPPSFAETGRKFFGRAQGTSLNPLDVQGVLGRTKTGFGPAAASNDIGYLTDSVNRLAPFTELLRKGIDPAEAARRVRDAQVDYTTKALTQAEQKLTRFVPFLRFLKGNVPSQTRELLQHPGGKLAQTFRALNNSRANDEIVPDYVQDTSGIRIGENVPFVGPGQGGPARYLTGLGLMYEDLGGLIGSGPTATARELATNLGPVAKFPIEWVTGKSLFQKGPEGPVDIADQDPLLGRLLANLPGVRRDEPVPTPQLLELALANSPLARTLSSARTLSDPRKNWGTAGLNLMTGLKFTDVPEKRRDAILRQLLNAQMERSGAKTFEKIYFPAEELQGMPPDEQRAALNATALQTELANRAKARAEQKRKHATTQGR